MLNRLKASCSRHREPPAVRRPVLNCRGVLRGYKGRSRTEEAATPVLSGPTFQASPSPEVPETLPRAHCGSYILRSTLATFLTRYLSSAQVHRNPWWKANETESSVAAQLTPQGWLVYWMLPGPWSQKGLCSNPSFVTSHHMPVNKFTKPLCTSASEFTESGMWECYSLSEIIFTWLKHNKNSTNIGQPRLSTTIYGDRGSSSLTWKASKCGQLINDKNLIKRILTGKQKWMKSWKI